MAICRDRVDLVMRISKKTQHKNVNILSVKERTPSRTLAQNQHKIHCLIPLTRSSIYICKHFDPASINSQRMLNVFSKIKRIPF